MSGELYSKNAGTLAGTGGQGQRVVSYVDGAGERKPGVLASYGGGGQAVDVGGSIGGSVGGMLATYGGSGQTVETAGGAAGQSGSQGTGTSYWDSMYGDLDTAYQAQRDQNQRALEAAQARAREASAAQVEALNRGYQGTNRQLYRDYMQRQRTLPQQLAAQGYTGGLTESSRLRMGNAYEEALNTNEQARLGQEASYGQDLAQRLYEAQATRDAADNEALQNYYSQRNGLRAQQLQQERADLETRAATMAAQGDFSLYRQLGYTDKEIAYLEKMFRKQHPELFKKTGSGGKKSSGGGGGRKNGTTPDPDSADSDDPDAAPQRRSYYPGRDGAIGQYTDTGTGGRSGGGKPSKKTDTSYADAIMAAQARGAWNGFA